MAQEFYADHPSWGIACGYFIVPCPLSFVWLYLCTTYHSRDCSAFVAEFRSLFHDQFVCLFFFGGWGQCSGLVEQISGKLFPRVKDRLRFLDLLEFFAKNYCLNIYFLLSGLNIAYLNLEFLELEILMSEVTSEISQECCMCLGQLNVL